MTRARKRFRKLCAFLLPLAGFALPPASAQEGPIVFGARESHPYFQLTDTHAWAEFLYRRESSVIKSKDQPADTFLENRFEETFTLETNAYIYHPNLVDLHLSGTFGLRQDSQDDSGDREQSNDVIYDYDLSATILRKEIAPLTLYSRRSEDVINRQFGPSLDHTLSQTGAIWDIRSKNIPTRIEVYHSDETESGFGNDTGEAAGSGDFSLAQNTVIWHSEAHPTKNQALSWDYTFSNVTQSTQGLPDDTFNTHDATLSHSVDFGTKAQNNLLSTINFFNQDGDFALQRIHWNELLRLRHTENFETRYQYTLDQQSFLGEDQLTNRGQAGFTHRLYKSLVTTGNIGAQQITRSDGGDSTEFFGDVRFDYTKQVPLGRFTAFTGVALDRQENQSSSNPTEVIDRPFTFDDTDQITILGQHIDPNSIRIKSANGKRIYDPSAYTVETVPGGVRVRRLDGGPIDFDQTVSVDYLIDPQAKNTTDTTLFTLGGRYDLERGPLKGVGVYARYTRQDQSIDSNDPAGFIPNSFTDILYGADYRWKGLTLGAERETHDSTVFPFNANRYYARFAQRLSLDTSYTLNTTYNQVEYPDENNQVNFLTVSGQLQQKITRELYGYATVVWRNEDDQLRGQTRGLEEQIELEWHHRQTSVYGLFRNAQLDTEQQNNNFQFIEVGIRREF